MRPERVLPLVLFVAFVADCSSPIAKSHVEGNVPQGKLYDEYLTRDLNRYFCGEAKDCRVEYEFLRDGPTQTGIAYPKYYLWAKSLMAGAVTIEGAVRVAAVEQRGFEVTHFLSSTQIAASPSDVASVFPAPLVETIIERAHLTELQRTKAGEKAAR